MWTRIQAFLDWCFFGPASVRAGLLGGSLRVLRYRMRWCVTCGAGKSTCAP